MPNRMFHYHQLWLEELKKVASAGLPPTLTENWYSGVIWWCVWEREKAVLGFLCVLNFRIDDLSPIQI
jgi:hypothetical protein